MSLSDNYPDIRPLWMNDYANAGVIDPRCSFARSDSTPSNVHYWSDEDHLSSENLVVQSQDLDTTWTVFPGTPAVTGGQTAPDGTTTAWVVTAQSASSAISQAQQSVSSVGATKTYTLSAYLKAGTASHTYMTLRGSGSTYGFVEIDWSDPLNLRVEKRTFSSASATVTEVGSGGWYRVALTTTTDASTSSGLVYIGPTDGTTQNANGYPVWNSSGETAIAWGVQLEERGSATAYNATTTQIHREYAATLKSVAYSGQPRFEYEPTGDRSAKGLLVESSVANVMAYSRNGYNSSNSFQYTLHSGVTATENAAVGPSGSLDATLLSEDSTTGTHQLQTTETVTSSAHTVSVYVKPVGVASFGIRINSGPVYGSVFTFATESFTNYGTTPEASRIEPVGNGWYRLSITQTVTSGSSLIRFNLFDSGGNASYAGNGYNGVLLWGFQCEANSFPSSFIDTGTSGSTSTRTADSLGVATADIGYTGGPVTIVAETEAGAGLGNAPRLFNLNDGGDTTRLMVYKDSTAADNTVAWTGYYGAAMMGALAGSNNSSKVAVSVDTNDFAADTDTGTLLTNASGTQHSFSHLYIGSNYNGTDHHINGHIKRVALYNEALTDTNLQALTS